MAKNPTRDKHYFSRHEQQRSRILTWPVSPTLRRSNFKVTPRLVGIKLKKIYPQGRKFSWSREARLDNEYEYEVSEESLAGVGLTLE